MHRVAFYVRVSSVGQNTDSQIDALRQWQTVNGLTDAQVEWFIDKASGATTDRPEFTRLEESIHNGFIKKVVVYKLDRLSRNLLGGLQIVSRWLQQDVSIHSLTQQFSFESATGRLVASLLLGLAEIERESIRERQAAGIAAAKARGKKWGGNKQVVKLATVKRCKELRSTGLTIKEIARSVGKSTRTVERYLTRNDGVA